MTGTEPLRDAIVLMLIGMGLVYLLLILLVLAIKLLGWLTAPVTGTVLPASSVPQEVAAAITIALHKHRQTRITPDHKENAP